MSNHPTPEEPIAAAAAPEQDPAIDLGAVAEAYLVEWRRWLLWTLGFFVLAFLLIMRIAPLYEATVLILPKSKDKEDPIALIYGARNSSTYVGLLESNTVLDSVVDRANLLTVYKTKSRETARNLLRGSTTVTAGTDSIVSVKIRDPKAETAARIANAYLDGLEDLQQRSALHDAELRSRFYQQQVAQESDALSAAEKDLEAVEEKTGVIEPAEQTQIGLTTIAAVRAQITTLQTQLASLLLSETNENPSVKELRSRLESLEAKEHSLESANASAGAGAASPASKMPGINLDYARKQRAVKYHETLLNSLAAQYENAKLSEDFSDTDFEIVDRAIVPERRSWPPRKLFLLFGALASFLLGSFALTATLFWRRLMADPVQRQRVRTIQASFRLRR